MPHCFLVTALVRHSICKFTKENKAGGSAGTFLYVTGITLTVLSFQKH